MMMVLSKEQIEEFNKASEPLIKWMAENLNPHTTALVDCTSAELLEGFCIHKTDEFIKD